MHLVPIPTTPEWVDRTFPLWSPFLPGIAKRLKETAATLLEQIARIEVQPVLIMDGERPVALVGVRYYRRNGELVAEIAWLSGKSMKRWEHLLADLETYLMQHVGVVEINALCRPGLMPFLKQRGYRIARYTMEKVL